MQTFKRLVVVADEIDFMDRPSISFQDGARLGVLPRFADLRLTVPQFPSTKSPSGPAAELHLPIISPTCVNESAPTSVGKVLRPEVWIASDEGAVIQWRAMIAYDLQALLLDRCLLVWRARRA
jgi:hypothetical protein